MTVWPEGSRSATAERIATVLPVPTSPVIIAMVFSDTAQAIRAAAWPPRVAWFRERTAPAAVRARARVPGASVTAVSFLLFRVFLFRRLLRAADEEPVGDLLAQGLVVAVAQGGQVVDPGRGRLGAGLPVRGAGLGV